MAIQVGAMEVDILHVGIDKSGSLQVAVVYSAIRGLAAIEAGQC